MKNFSTYLRFVALFTLITLGIGRTWGKTFSDGDVLFFDFTSVTGGGGVNWQVGDATMAYDASGAGTIKCVIFTKSVAISTSWVIAKTAKGSWTDIKFTEPSSGQNCIKIGADGKSMSWTTISLAEKVAKGDLIMVYGGELSSWNQNLYYFMSANNTDNAKEIAFAQKTITIYSQNYKFGAVAIASGTYYQGHWASNMSCAIAAGSAYVVRGSGASTTYFTQKTNSGSDYLYQVKKQGSTSPTTSLSPTCPSSITAGSKLSFTPGSAGVSVLGLTNSIKYYLKNGSTYTEKTLSDGKLDVSDLGVGDYSIITLLYDGYIYVKASTSNFSVTAAATRTLTYHANWYTTGTSGSVPAAQTVAVGANATVAGNTGSLAMTNYTFSGWNTAEYITGTDYRAGDNITMNENKDLYAKWTRSITLNQNGATTNGTASVTGTYNCATLPSIANPSKTGYVFGGWNTENDGSGNLVINTSGVLQSNVYHWTDQTTPSNRFQRNPSSTSPLYALWTQTVTLNANTANHGSGNDGSATIILNATTKSSITHCTPASGYKLKGYYTAATNGTKILNADGSFASTSITNYITSGKWTKADATTLYAQYEEKTKVRLYYSNPDGWATVKAYVWYNSDGNDHNADWSGVDITSNTLVINGDTYYYYEYYKEDHPNWNRVIFNDGSHQTEDITFSNTDNNGQYHNAGDRNGSHSSGSWQALPAQETTYAVTFNAGANGSISANGTAISAGNNAVVNIGATARALTATPAAGYAFDNWTTTGGASVADASSASTTVTATAVGTVTANYASQWCIRGSDEELGNWGTYNSMSNTATNTFSTSITLVGSHTYKFKVFNRSTGEWLGKGDGSSYTTLTRASNSASSLASGNDINLTTDVAGSYTFTYNSSTSTITITYPTPSYTITYKDQGDVAFSGTHASGYPTTHTYGTATTLKTASKTGYDFGGWFTASNCSGTAVTSLGATDYTANIILYAKWTAKTYSITYKDQGNVTYTGSNSASLPATYTYGIGIASLTDGIKSNYSFDGWFDNQSCTGSAVTSISTTATGNKTFYAKWTENPGGTVTLTAGTGGEVSKDNSSWGPSKSYTGVKTTTALNIYARASTGYTFSSWTRTSGTGTIANMSSASTTYTPVAYADAQLTASFNETMRTINIVGGTTASTTAGVSTTGSATAAAPAAGKKFTGWTLGTGVTLSGGALTDRTINFTATQNSTVTANYADRASVKVYFAKPSGWSTVYVYAWKDGGTENATWPGEQVTTTETINYVTYYVYQYYTEADGIGNAATGNAEWDKVIFNNNNGTQTADLSLVNGHYYFKSTEGGTSGKAAALTSAWCIMGDWNSWNEDADQITHSAAATGSKTISFTTGNQEFKIYNIVEQTWWRFSGDVSATKAATTMANNIDGNMTLVPSVAGDYIFALSSLTGTPKLAVTFPTTYTLTYSIGTVAGNNGSISTSPTTASGSLVLSGTTITLTAPAAKSGYTWKGWYTNDGGTTGKINDTNRAITVTMDADKTLYACYTENTYAVTFNAGAHGSISVNGTNIAANGSQSIQIGTVARTLTATPAAGYAFTGWEKTGSVTIANASSASTTVTATGTGTVTATYEEDLSSPYTLKGGTNITGDDWATAHNFTKKTGHSAESVAYCTFNISSTNAGVNGEASEWSFKVVKDGSTWYGLSAGGDSYWWLRSTSANQELNTSGKNIQLCADVAGEYEIKIDYTNSSSPKVTVTYPTGVSLAASKSQYVRGQSITFTATPYGGTSPTYQYRYKKDDGAYNSYSGSGTSFSFTPTETGTYTVEVKMTSGGTDYLATTTVTIVDASIPCSWTEPDWSNDTKMTWDGTNSRFYYSRSFDSDSWHEFKITNGMWCNNDDNCEVWDCHNKNTSTSQNVTYDCTDNNNVKFQPAATGIATIYFDPSTNDIWIIGCSTPSITSVRTTYDILANASTQVGPTSVTNANTYSWEIISGTGGSFASGSSVTTSTVLNPTFYPQSGVNRTYVLRLTVSNDCGQSKTQDYTVYAWQTMPKVTLNVTNSSGDSNWGTSTIYAYWYKDGSHNGFVPLTYSAGTWTGDIPKNTAELGYKIYICKEQNTSSAVRTYDSNEYGYVEIPAGNAYYKTYNLDIIPTKGTQQQFGLTERCESFTLQNSTFTLGNQSNISIAVSKKSDSPHNIPEGATYLWSCIQGLNGDDLLSSNTDAAPTFYKTRNGQTATGRYVFQVTVTNPRNTDCFAVALITIDCWAEKYYLKHAKSANNTNWGWDEMTYQGDGMYTCSEYYDGDDSNVGAKVSIDKKIRVNAKVYDQDLCSGQSWGATTLHYWDGSGSHDVTSYEKSAYDGYQFIIPEGQSFTLWDEYFDSGNSNTNSHHTVDWVGPENDDVYFLIKKNPSADDCNTSYAIYESWASGHSGAEYPDGYVRYDGYRTKDNILGHEHAAGTVLWVYNAATDELSISESGTYYRLASTVPAKSSTNFAGTAGKTYYSNGIKSTDIGNTAAALVSMYVAGGADVRLQESTNGGVTYSDVSSPAVGYAGPAADGVWNAHLSSTNSGATLDWSRYTGDYYLRSKGLLNNTANYKTANAKFVKFEPDRSNINEFYNNYWAGHLVKGENISAMVANDLNPCLSDELGSYYVGLGNYAPNIRYAYDTLTNHFSYSLLNGSTAGLEFLTVFGGLNVYDKAGSDKQLLTQANAEELSDQSNWVYVAEIYANANATVRLLGKYQKEYGGTPILNWLLGNGDNLVTLPVLTTNSPDDIRHLLVSYDFKTNKIVVGWIPEGDNINANITLEGNLILRRENNQDVKTFSLATNKTITGLERAYFNFILKPDRYTYTDDDGVERTFVNPNTDGLTAEHNIYWFSLPFDCEVKDIFGIAGYGTDWVIQRYRGDARAHYSWTSNISTFWRNVPLTYTLKAGEGYALVFKADRIKFSAITVDETTTVQNSIFFPSKDLIGNVTDQVATATYPENICTAQNGLRKAEDSNWQVIGPITYEETVSFSNYTPSSADQPSAAGKTYPNFLYVFDDPFQKSQGNNNPISAYQVKDGSDFEYRTTYSYMTQFAGTINWQPAASSVTSNAPRRRVNGQNEQVQGTNHRESYEIQLITNTDTLDHTYVVLATGSDADFMPGEDLYKFSEGGKSVVYTEASEKPAAGNALPYQSQEVPLTVNLAESGDYTFALDGDIDGTTGVQLVDNADGVTTDLRQYSYSATLPAGETRGRFTLIFTIDAGQHGGQTTGLTDLYENTLVRVVDGRIVVDGMPAGATLNLYDATGKLIYGAKSQEQGTKNSWQSAPLPQGVYMLRIGNHTTKVVL